MLLTAVAFAQLVRSCDREDSARTLASVAYVESGFETWALHDNSTGKTYVPTSLQEAVSTATRLIEKGHPVDVGLMQIDSVNFARLGLTLQDALAPCRSIEAGAELLREGFGEALREAFSRYNTGSPDLGFTNGYVSRVEAASLRLPSLDADDYTAKHDPAIVSKSATNPTSVDLLHGTLIDQAHGEVINLLIGEAIVAAPTVEIQDRSSAVRKGNAVD